MSTLGNKGERERNPKPKFAALDINSLYRSTRGETFEPATQKNAAPRKHGMQSLGKVPSARRPANLPSLKAETSTPANPPTTQNSIEQQPQVAQWVADSNSSGQQQVSNSTNVVSNPSNNNNNINNSGGTQNQLQQQHSSSSNSSNSNNNNNSNSSTWSAVATGNVKEDSALQPPLYQSPQFQNEFPSLDGTLMNSTSNMNVGAMTAQQKLQQNQNSFDSGGTLNLRPSTDAASWMQQQQQSNSGNARGGGGENGQQGSQGNFPIQDIDGPPKVMALMPSFLRGGNTGIANISTPPLTNVNQSNSHQQQHKSNMNYGNNNRPGRNSSHYNDYSNGLPPRHHRQQQQQQQYHNSRHSGRQNNNNNNNNNDDRSSSYEPELIVQRPIIKEEELERIDSLARDDAWSKHDEIDYNKKLQFSDDEADDMKPKDNDKRIDVWRDSEKRDIKQQNGPRSIDPSYVEKMKMVREEEERLERERKSAAQRKLQELEEKSKQKMQISLDKPHEKDMEEKPTSGINYTINDSDKKIEHQQQSRDYGKSKYDKYDTYDSQYGRNNSNNINNNNMNNTNNSAGGDLRKSTFQSNLPPRFQKQQHHIDDRRDNKATQNSNYKPLHQQDSKNIPFVQHPQSSSYDQQPQQQRWMQYNSNNNKGNQQAPPPRRNMSSLSQSSSDDNRQNSKQSSYNNRRRQESEEDDYGRFVKDSSNSNNNKIQKSTITQSAQISRSMSDSSDKLSDHNRSEKSTSREFLTGTNVCWAEVCENDKRSSLDAKDKRRVSESSAISDDQPRTILQRNKPIQEQLQTKDVIIIKKESKEVLKDEEQKTVLIESPPKELNENENLIKKEKSVEAQQNVTVEQQQQQNKKSLEIIPEKKEQSSSIVSDKPQIVESTAAKDMMKPKEISPKDLDENRHTGNKRSPHSNRYDMQPSSRGRGNSSYGGYRGNWQRRGSGHPRSGRYDYSDSENSEEYDHDWNRGPKSNRRDINRRDNYGASNNAQKEGFSPKGEPSRRGRGGSITGSSNFRRTGSNISSSSSITAPVKRIDNYGPPSSKSPFGSNDEKSNSEKKDVVKDKEKVSDDDRTKQKQKALSDGLINKSMKDSTNIVMQQKSSSPVTTASVKSNEEPASKQHSNDTQQPITQSSSQDTNIKKSNNDNDDKASNDGKSSIRSNSVQSSSQSYNSSRQQKYEKSSSSASINKGIVNKPAINSTQQSTGKMSSSSPSTIQSTAVSTPQSQPSSTQYNSKPIDSRNSNNNNNNNNNNSYRDTRSNDPRNSGSNRMAPRFVKQQRDNTSGNSGNSRVGTNYWDKNNSDGLNNDENVKVSMMQQMNQTNNSGNGTLAANNQQQVSNNPNVLNSKTDAIKQTQTSQPTQQQQQQQQQQHQQTMNTAPPSGNQPMLDGASLPKQTLIFENTSYKSAPPSMKRPPPQLGPNAMNQQQHQQKDSTPTINEMIEQQAKDHSLSSALQNLSFGQKSNDMVDMNFKFSFDTQLTDDGNGGFGSVSNSATHTSQQVVSKSSSSLGLVGAKTGMQNSNILNTDALNMKVASCKKVWEEPSVDHSNSNTDDVMANFVAQQQLQHYAHNNINAHHTGLSPQSFGYPTNSTANDVHSSSLEHFNKSNDNDDANSYPSPHMSAHVMHSQNQQANLNMKAAEAFATTANVCKVKPTQQQMHQSGLSPPPQLQQNQLQQHQQTFYQTPSYANMPTIPSPPVVYNSAQATPGGLYNPYNLDHTARAQMYSYPTASATNNSLSFNAFMQTPNLASAPTHEMYQNLSQYRATVQPYNQTAQLNNPNAAVLISSATASNSMMGSKSNTPQQIGAIGSKSSAPQSAPTATAGQYNQQYMNHLYHQNSYYPNSTAQQGNPYYNATGTAATGNYGMFSGTTSAPPQQQMNYGSVGQFPLNSQMLNNLVINQQYRSGPVVNAAGSSNGGSATSGSSSNTGSGYMKQQQHQSQLQDPTSSVKYSSMNESHSSHNNNKMYNWDISPSISSSNSYNQRGYNSQNQMQSYGSSQHPSAQRMQKSNNNNQLFPNLSSSSQGKSQFYNNSSQSGSK